MRGGGVALWIREELLRKEVKERCARQSKNKKMAVGLDEHQVQIGCNLMLWAWLLLGSGSGVWIPGWEVLWWGITEGRDSPALGPIWS